MLISNDTTTISELVYKINGPGMREDVQLIEVQRENTSLISALDGASTFQGRPIFIIENPADRLHARGFYIGDIVISGQPGLKYSGTIREALMDRIVVDTEKPRPKDSSGGWMCHYSERGLGTAYGNWDYKSLLIKSLLKHESFFKTQDKQSARAYKFIIGH